MKNVIYSLKSIIIEKMKKKINRNDLNPLSVAPLTNLSVKLSL